MRATTLFFRIVAHLLLIVAPTMSHAQSASFQGLGFLPGNSYSITTGVSADGSVVVGYSANGADGPYQAFRWTATTGMVGLGFVPGGTSAASSSASGVNSDGSVIVGYDNGTDSPFRWTAATGMVAIGGPGIFVSAAAVNADGSVVVGWGPTPSRSAEQPIRWTTAGILGLGFLPGYSIAGFAHGVNADGSVVIGEVLADPSGTPQGQAFRWTAANGMVGLGFVPGYDMRSIANGVNADGSVVVGVSQGSTTNNAFRWTAATGMIGIGGDTANGVSGEGTIVVGIDSNGEAFRWT